MRDLTAYAAPRIFDGMRWHEHAALLCRGDRVEAVLPRSELLPGTALTEIRHGMLVPGFVDLQVNGGGGVMLNNRQDVETIRTICSAHAQFGTTAVLPTLITDTPAVTEAAIAAGRQAATERVPGFAGLHLEGPHLSLARKGAHDPKLIRPMEAVDEARLTAARAVLPALLTTVAPETVRPDQIARLRAADIVVSLGHSDSTAEQVRAAAAAGASMVTHLFNAMSQIANREPGVVGAALDHGSLWAGLIADGVHVDAANVGIALRAKRGPARIFLVTDAMAPIGTDMRSFTLNGRVIRREDGRLTLEDGTLAGADLDMISAVRFIHRIAGFELAEALKMASLYPAQAMGMSDRHGQFRPGALADFAHLTENLDVQAVWIGGNMVFRGGAAT